MSDFGNGDRAWHLLMERIAGLERKVDGLMIAVIVTLLSVVGGLITAFTK